MATFRVFIADDNATARNTLQELLFRKGFNVCGEAENGLEAVAKIIDLEPDAVILDLAMPFADGLAAAGRISEVLPGTPMVLYTLHVLPQLEIEAKKHGIQCVVSKAEPMKILAFLDRLRNVGEFRDENTTRDARQTVDATTALAEKSAGTSSGPMESLAQPDDLKEAS